jgi:hypothetical protein
MNAYICIFSLSLPPSLSLPLSLSLSLPPPPLSLSIYIYFNVSLQVLRRDRTPRGSYCNAHCIYHITAFVHSIYIYIYIYSLHALHCIACCAVADCNETRIALHCTTAYHSLIYSSHPLPLPPSCIVLHHFFLYPCVFLNIFLAYIVSLRTTSPFF